MTKRKGERGSIVVCHEREKRVVSELHLQGWRIRIRM
jgi:hypothetical protein